MKIDKAVKNYFAEKIADGVYNTEAMKAEVMKRLPAEMPETKNGGGWIGQLITGVTIGLCVLYGTVILTGANIRPKLAEYTQAAYSQADVPAKLRELFGYMKDNLIK